MPNPTIHGQTHLTYPQTDFPVAGTRAGADPVPLSDIWNVRARSFNAIGNPNFEIDQRTVGVGTTTTATFAQDRWLLNFSGSLTASSVQNDPRGNILIPGTNFGISQFFNRITLTAQDSSPGAGDYLFLSQFVEGIRLRELLSDYHSLSVIVRSSVAGTVFSIALRDVAHAYSLLNICTIPNTNQWTVCQLPALPIWTPSATWNTLAGNEGYELDIVLMSGSTFKGAASSLWQTGNFLALPSIGNFAANPISSTFDIAFVQHEPGPYCTMPMDLSFSDNLLMCERYFQKTYDYSVAVGAAIGAGILTTFNISATATRNIGIKLVPDMAKTPTVTPYNSTTGSANSVVDQAGPTNVAITGVNNPSTKTPFSALTAASGFTTSNTCALQYVADTGW